MTQQINLFQPERYANRVPVSTRRMALVVTAALFLAAAAGAVDYWRTTTLGSQLSRLQERRNTAVQRIDDYQHRYPPRTADPELVRRVATMTHEREADLALLRLLTDGQLGNNRGLSEHLAGLARQDLSTVWLRRIRFSVGGERLLLEGSCTRAADIPLFLQRLSEQAVFAGREFEHLQLSRSEKTTAIIDFLLQTTPQEAP
jgi:hypothetical protein